MAAPKIHLPTFSTQPGRTRVAIYARVSTAHNGQDPAMQTRELEEYCQRRGWELEGCYVDNGISGSKESRPELDRLMVDAHRRRFDAVAVWKFDRFARSVSHLLRALETFKALGIDFVSLSEQVDTSTPTGKMVFTVLGAVAELERSLIAERVHAGIRNARAKGKRLGRREPPWMLPESPPSAPRGVPGARSADRQALARGRHSAPFTVRTPCESVTRRIYDASGHDYCIDAVNRRATAIFAALLFRGASTSIPDGFYEDSGVLNTRLTLGAWTTTQKVLVLKRS